MSIETLEELEGLKRAGAVVADALAGMRARVAPGVTTGDLDDVAAVIIERHGANPAPRAVYGFPGTACISVNEEAVHGVPGDRVLNRGDIVTLDVTIELDGFYADAAVTVGVGTISERAQRLLDCAEAAFWTGARAAQGGQRMAVVGGRVEAEVERRGFWVMRDLCGHGIGRSIHEDPQVCNFYDARDRTRLHEGLVIALEPIVAETGRETREEADGWTLSSRSGGLTAHFEHTIVITAGMPIVVTA